MQTESIAPSRLHSGLRVACAGLLLALAAPVAGHSQAFPEPADETVAGLETAAAQGAKKNRRRQRPMKLGTSGGSIEDFTVDPPDILCCSGTLGALLRKGDRHFILSNNHVIGRVNQAAIGEIVSQPGLIDSNCEAPSNNLVGTVSGFKRIKLQGTNKVDAALAETSLDVVAADGAIIGLGVPGNEIVKPRVGAAVIKSGRTTGVTRGEVSMTNVSGSVSFPLECGADEAEEVRFSKVFLVVSTNNKDFSRGGDSGSVIYEKVGDCPRAMGLLFAGTDDFTAANPMKLVMKAVKKMAPKGAKELVGCAPAAPSSDRLLASAATDRAERSAMRVQRRMEDDVLAVPGVVAIGIGRGSEESRTGAGDVLFKVLVEDARPETVDAIPESLNGVPVEIVVSGKLRALSCPGTNGAALGGLEATGVR